MGSTEEQAQKWLRDNNKCGSRHADGFLCTLTTNHIGQQHRSEVINGIDDGKVLAEWPW